MSLEHSDPSVNTEEMRLSVGYLCGLWNLSREEVLEKIKKDKLPNRIVNGEIRVLSSAVPVGGK